RHTRHILPHLVQKRSQRRHHQTHAHRPLRKRKKDHRRHRPAPPHIERKEVRHPHNRSKHRRCLRLKPHRHRRPRRLKCHHRRRQRRRNTARQTPPSHPIKSRASTIIRPKCKSFSSARS